jgi:DNA-binding beta-propeller fold protein YncE
LYFDSYSATGCNERIASLESLERKFDKQLVCIGVHTPVFKQERTHSHVQKAVNRLHINFPVVNDPNLLLNHHYRIAAWPAYTLIGVDGTLKGTLSGDDVFKKLVLIISDLATQVNKEGHPVHIALAREAEHDLFFPSSLHATSGLLYIADSGNNRILSTSHSGVVRSIFGSKLAGFLDGTGSGAAFNNPRGLEKAGDFIYVADTGNHAIRRINVQTYDVDTLAGNGAPGKSGSQGTTFPLETSLNSPCDLVFDGGNLYITVSGTHQVWELSLIDQTIGVFTGSGLPGLKDGPPDEARFDQPAGIALTNATLYVADACNSRIRSIDLSTGYVHTLELESKNRPDSLQFPQGIIPGPPSHSLLVADTYNNRVCEIDLNNHTVSCITDNKIDEACGLALSDNRLYIANTNRHEIITLDLAEKTAHTLDVRNEANCL